jgi:hypothetical protein
MQTPLHRRQNIFSNAAEQSVADLKLQSLPEFSRTIKSVKNAMNKDREELLHEKSKI